MLAEAAFLRACGWPKPCEIGSNHVRFATTSPSHSCDLPNEEKTVPSIVADTSLLSRAAIVSTNHASLSK